MSEQSSYSLAYITAPDTDIAKKIGSHLIETRLAACVNIVPGMSSLYHWKGTVQEDFEVIILAKTTVQNQNELISCVTEMHPYECPCVIILPIMNGYQPFLQWIDEETRK